MADGTRAWDVDVETGWQVRDGRREYGVGGTSSVVSALPRKRRPDATQLRPATASVAVALSSTRQVASLQVNAC